MKNRTEINNAQINIVTKLVGSNPEMADMGNPRGDVYSDFGQVEATDMDGRIFILTASYIDLWDLEEEKLDVLQRLVDRVLAAGDIDPALWVFDRWTYGTAGWDDEINQMESDALANEPIARL
mgnify:CR=1 FL=1|tara:strand:+ start:44015 stop:44383 length:369 start_codon:yes stop_codon:yes gene_type:complete